MTAHGFDDSEAYEQFMGRWSRSIGAAFLAWLQPPIGADWLEVGCGTGIFTALIERSCAPATVIGIDPAQSQINHAGRRAETTKAVFRLGDAQDLPFDDASFDAIALPLVLNFIPDRARALSEIHRVARPGALIAACVWDFVAERSPSGPLRRAMRRIGIDVPPVPGTDASGLSTLAELFARERFNDVVTATIEVTVSFDSFDDFWSSQTPDRAPITRLIATLAPKDQDHLREMLRLELRPLACGGVEYSACANAIRVRRRS